MYSVYCHASPDGKRYVGITRRNPLRRWQNGKGYANNKHFYSAILKYGWDNFTHEILFSELTEEEAQKIERDLIAKWKLTDRRYGYNYHQGGEVCSEEASKIASRKLKGRVGHPLSQEQKKILSELHKGKKWTLETREKIMATRNKKTEERLRNAPVKASVPHNKRVYCDGILYESVKECASAVGSSITTINPYLNGTRKMPKKWADRGLRYADIDKEYVIAQQRGEHSKKKIVVDGVEYESQKICAEALGISPQLLSNRLHGYR